MYSKYILSVFVLVLLVDKSYPTPLNICGNTPLDNYINTPDSSVFGWQLLQTYPQSTYTLYVLNVTSQRWLNDSFSTRSIWWHYVTIAVPTVFQRPKTALLLVEGTSNSASPPSSSPISWVAVSSGSIAAVLYQVPNQPVRFSDDPTGASRTEDGAIAWTWNKFIQTNGNDPTILYQFPMTKAVIRAMDAIQGFLGEQNIPVPEKFAVAGGSKRGWATWLAAAVDKTRVFAAIPVVLDILNIQANMKGHYRSLSGYTLAFKDYYDNNITRNLDNPYFAKMASIIDPYHYFCRYTNTKIFQLQGSSDEFFLPDSEDYFWTKLQLATIFSLGTYLRRIPNTGHALTGYEGSLLSFYLSVSDKQILPLFNWKKTTNETHGKIYASVTKILGRPAATNVTGYFAYTVNGTKRDFRRAKVNPATGQVVPNPVVWVNTPINIEIQNNYISTYSLTIPNSPNGTWTGAFIQATFPGPNGTELILTTETLIVPNTYPSPQCYGEGCYGTLV